jgi:hypothetical protein
LLVDEHALYPKTPAEEEALIQRLELLSGHVMDAQEWSAILSAARQLLPRKNKEFVSPDALDLLNFCETPAGRILTAILSSFSAVGTYANNRRYSLERWVPLIRSFYELAPYVVPPRTLGFAYQLLRSARKAGDDLFVRALSAVVRNEPMLVRQVASPADLLRGANP